jgi:hypothetical protein
MLKTIAFTILVPVALVAIACSAISFRLMPSGLWRIGPGYRRAKARFGSVTAGGHGEVRDTGVLLAEGRREVPLP